VRRRTAIIISNMAKLVPEPAMAAPMLPKLLPGLKKLRDEVSDPEVRDVATKCDLPDEKLEWVRCVVCTVPMSSQVGNFTSLTF
jgi:hypothetical protein